MPQIRVLHRFLVLSIGLLLSAEMLFAQDFERYRPKTIPAAPAPSSAPREELPPVEGSDRVLVASLDAVIVLDQQDKIDPNNAFEDYNGVYYEFDAGDSLVHSEGFQAIVRRYLGDSITLRKLNQMSRDLILYYRKQGQPVVDIVIPEQRITAGTVQIVVTESRVGNVVVQDGCYFDAEDLRKWVCTRPGARIYEAALSNDLFWLNQNAFRRVNVDLKPGRADGTTDVVFEVDDVKPWNAYLGYEDTGVPNLYLERLYAGLIWGNALGRGGTLSYQYTADREFRRLHAHALSYLEPLNRKWSFQTYGSWARVDPIVNVGVAQDGESWQVGLGMFRHLRKNRTEDTSLSFGFDFKTTNNNLEFGGVRVSNSSADLAQLRLGYQSVKRYDCDEYSIVALDTFVGPGGGFSSAANATSFNTIRPDTSPDYIYARLRLERLWSLKKRWQLVGRFRGQAASERLLFSETLGFGGYDSIRGYDQRAFSGDHGWILNVELGPKPWRYGCGDRRQTLRVYGLFDAGTAFVESPRQSFEPEDETLISTGVGMRWNFAERANLRLDYAYGFNDSTLFDKGGRIHVGLVALLGPRP
jgi:hemolysin activation/secretion protein